MNVKTTKNLHLTLDDRVEIQECLSHGMTFKAIGKRIGKDQTTVSKEVKKHIEIVPTAVRRTDGKGNIVVAPCPKLQKPPFCCNPCPMSKRPCSFDKHIYRAKGAQDEYKQVLKESREGIPLTKPEFWEIDRVVSKGIRDTVIGRVGGKCLITFNSVPSNFMFGLLINDKSALAVSEKIKALKRSFHDKCLRFGDTFPEILTDNGGEFADVFTIENSLQGMPETHLFFCDPYQSSQKPHVEKTHSCFRDIVPKGTSFDDWTQENLNLIFSHLNSAKRKNLNGKSALEAFSFWHDPEVATLLGILPIEPLAVMQNKKLLETMGLLSQQPQ